MVCSLHSVTTGSRDRANVSLIIIIHIHTYIYIYIYIYYIYIYMYIYILCFFRDVAFSKYFGTIINYYCFLFLFVSRGLVVRFPFPDGVFLPCGHGLDFDTSFCENS